MDTRKVEQDSHQREPQKDSMTSFDQHLRPSVNLAPVPDLDHRHHQRVVFNAVDDAVDALPNAVARLQTLPICNEEDWATDVPGNVAGFSLHAGVAAKAYRRCSPMRSDWFLQPGSGVNAHPDRLRKSLETEVALEATSGLKS